MGAVSVLLGVSMGKHMVKQQMNSIMALGGRNETMMRTSDLVALPGAGIFFLLGSFSSWCYCHCTPEAINNSGYSNGVISKAITHCIPAFGPNLVVLRNST